jgi:hypothetical protein
MIGTTTKTAVIAAGIIMVITGFCIGGLVAPDPGREPGWFVTGGVLVIFGALLAVVGAVTPRRQR